MLCLLKALGLTSSIVGAALCSVMLALFAESLSRLLFGGTGRASGEATLAIGSLAAGLVIAVFVFIKVRKHGFGAALAAAFFIPPWIVFSGAFSTRTAVWVFQKSGFF